MSFVQSVAFGVMLAALGQAPPTPDPNDPYRQPGYGSYWGYPRIGNPVAEIIDSQGQYLINVEQAAAQREKNRKEKIATRRQEIEFWVWRQGYLAQADEEQRKRVRELEITHSIEEPSATEIFAGIALNKLLDELIRMGPASPSTALDPNLLSAIHLGSKADRGLSVLSKETIPWPPLLAVPEFAQARSRIEKLLNEIKSGLTSARGASQETLLQLRREIRELRDRLREGVRTDSGTDVLWTPSNYTAAVRLLRQIDENAFTLANNPKAAFYLKAPQAVNVADLVTYMKDNGLNFIEAMAGDERQYIALQHAMADELRRVRKAEGIGK
jgi:hypothetical protein